MRQRSLALGVKLNRLAERRLLREMGSLGEDLKRYWSKVRKDDECWKWTDSLGGTGYGQFLIFNRKLLPHRISYILHKKSIIPEGLLACHICDNPSCVNPKHIFIGSQKDNLMDCSRKKRCSSGEHMPKGELSKWSKLKEKDVLDIFKLLNARVRQIDIAKKFNVTQSNVSEIKRGNSWKHLKEKRNKYGLQPLQREENQNT